MKKALVAIIMASAAFIGAKAEMLYWMVNTDTSTTQNNPYSVSEGVTANYAELYAWNGSTMTLLDSTTTFDKVMQFNTESKSYNYAGATYWIEISTYNSGDSVPQSNSYYGEFKYQDLVLNASTLGNDEAKLAALKATWSGVSRHSGHVPEPTSGLMMLVGMALLGLKRRRV